MVDKAGLIDFQIGLYGTVGDGRISMVTARYRVGQEAKQIRGLGVQITSATVHPPAVS